MLFLSAALCLVLLLWVAWWSWRGWHEARSLPFARAWHKQKKYKPGTQGDDTENWLALHRAIDQCAGRNVSSGSIDELLKSVHWLEPFSPELHSFYQQSTQRFFATGSQPANFNVANLAKQLYLAERHHTATLANTSCHEPA